MTELFAYPGTDGSEIYKTVQSYPSVGQTMKMIHWDWGGGILNGIAKILVFSDLAYFAELGKIKLRSS